MWMNDVDDVNFAFKNKIKTQRNIWFFASFRPCISFHSTPYPYHDKMTVLCFFVRYSIGLHKVHCILEEWTLNINLPAYKFNGMIHLEKMFNLIREIVLWSFWIDCVALHFIVFQLPNYFDFNYYHLRLCRVFESLYFFQSNNALLLRLNYELNIFEMMPCHSKELTEPTISNFDFFCGCVFVLNSVWMFDKCLWNHQPWTLNKCSFDCFDGSKTDAKKKRVWISVANENVFETLAPYCIRAFVIHAPSNLIFYLPQFTFCIISSCLLIQIKVYRYYSRDSETWMRNRFFCFFLTAFCVGNG